MQLLLFDNPKSQIWNPKSNHSSSANVTFSTSKKFNSYGVEPPKIVIEIDTKAAFEFIDEGGYYHKKTQKLLDFGVEKVIWFYIKSQKVMIAQKEKSWTIDDWNKNIEVMPDLNLCLTDLMAKKGITV